MSPNPDFFEALLGEAFNPAPKPSVKANPPVEKGVQLRGRELGGTYYIRADDVVGLLEANRVLPTISALIKARIRSC